MIGVAGDTVEVRDGQVFVNDKAIDEPYLCSFGSAFVNVPRNDCIAAIDASVTAIHKEGALAGPRAGAISIGPGCWFKAIMDLSPGECQHLFTRAEAGRLRYG